jgi:hypothetical protein
MAHTQTISIDDRSIELVSSTAEVIKQAKPIEIVRAAACPSGHQSCAAACPVATGDSQRLSRRFSSHLDCL